jgi:mono/diheme cytochrome c family protein
LFARVIVFVQLFAGPASNAGAQTGDPGAGAVYAQQVCAKCHAIDRTGSSPEPTAPPFKDVANTPGMTATALAVFLTTNMHQPRTATTMPNIVLDRQELDNIIAYITSLKDSPRPGEGQ